VGLGGVGRWVNPESRGERVGLPDGEPEGALDGATVGVPVGAALGNAVGSSVHTRSGSHAMTILHEHELKTGTAGTHG